MRWQRRRRFGMRQCSAVFGKMWQEAVNSLCCRQDERPLRAAAEKQSIQKQKDHRADDGHDPPSDIILAHEQATDPSAYERAGDAEQNRNDATTWIFSRHQQFRDGANNKTYHQGPKNRVRAEVHKRMRVIRFAAPRQGLLSEQGAAFLVRSKLDHLRRVDVFARANLFEQRPIRRRIEIQDR